MSAPVIELTDVVKRFGELTAVDGLTLRVPAGTCFGLLGPNGAGKSTLMRLLTGQAVATSGRLRVLGRELPDDSRAVRARSGVVPQIDNLDEELTVRENLEVFARLYAVPREVRPAAVARGLRLARLTDRAGSPTRELSGGMRRRLLISRALLHEPELVLLDEPTVGLDPQVRQELWAQIRDILAAGTTVLMSTHYIEEAERLCDEVAIMHDGSVVAEGSPAELIDRHVGAQVVEVGGTDGRLADVERHAADAGLRTRRAGTSVALLGVETAGTGIRLPDGHRRDATLEDVFVVLTGEQLR